MATDLDAMPDPCSACAPYFSGQPNEPLVAFLQEFDALATSHKLNDGQKVRTILEYIPPTVRDFWKTLDGFDTGDWQTFCTTIESLYPSATKRYTNSDLEDFVDISAMSRMKDEGDVMLYYRRFLQMSTPLYNSKQLSDDQRNTEFFEGFHIKDRHIIARRLYILKPYHPSNIPWDFQDVLKAARLCFPCCLYYPSFFPDRLRDDPDRLRSTDISQTIERWFGREESDPRFRWQKPSQSEEDRKLEEIIKKLHGLSVHDPAYTVLYAQCKLRFPEVAQELVKPVMFQSAASAPVYQAPATQPRTPDSKFDVKHKRISSQNFQRLARRFSAITKRAGSLSGIPITNNLQRDALSGSGSTPAQESMDGDAGPKGYSESPVPRISDSDKDKAKGKKDKWWFI